MASELITHSAIDSEPIRARGIIVKEPFIRSIMRFSFVFLIKVLDRSQSYLCNINTYTKVGLQLMYYDNLTPYLDFQEITFILILVKVLVSF